MQRGGVRRRLTIVADSRGGRGAHRVRQCTRHGGAPGRSIIRFPLARSRFETLLVTGVVEGRSLMSSIQRPGSRRVMVPWLAVASAMVMALAIVGVVLLTKGRSAAPSVANTAASGTSAEVAQFAVDEGAKAGDSTPTNVIWVSSTLTDATNLLSGPSSGSSTSTPAVYVVEESGDFTLAGNSPMPAEDSNARPATGSVLFFVVDQSSWRVYGWGLQKSPTPLGSLGVVTSASASRLTAGTIAEFRAEFHIPQPRKA